MSVTIMKFAIHVCYRIKSLVELMDIASKVNGHALDDRNCHGVLELLLYLSFAQKAYLMSGFMMAMSMRKYSFNL